jgi:hypothetical protein
MCVHAYINTTGILTHIHESTCIWTHMYGLLLLLYMYRHRHEHGRKRERFPGRMLPQRGVQGLGFRVWGLGFRV